MIVYPKDWKKDYSDFLEPNIDVQIRAKVDYTNTKKIMTKIAKHLNVPDKFINRNKYGFCDAF